MGTKQVTANDFREFFTTFGVKPIDLTKSKEPGWDLREGIEKVGKQMVENGDGRFITEDNLKDRPIRLNVFHQIEMQDTQIGITPGELAQSLETAGLLKLSQGKYISTLWSSFESAKWEMVKHSSEHVLIGYLRNNPNDATRSKALDLIEADVKHHVAGFYNESFHPDVAMTEAMLASSDLSIRSRYLNLFGVSQSPSAFGESTVEIFNGITSDFSDVLNRLQPSDGNTMQALLESGNPSKVVFGLLLARKLSSPDDLRKLCLKVAAKPNAKETVVFKYTVWNGCDRKDFNASLWELANALGGNQTVSSNSPARESGGGCDVSKTFPTGDVF